MVDQPSSAVDAGDARRVEEMKWLRRLYLPHICFLIHSVHHATEDSVEVTHTQHAQHAQHTQHNTTQFFSSQSLKLADVIADEKYQLYKVHGTPTHSNQTENGPIALIMT